MDLLVGPKAVTRIGTSSRLDSRGPRSPPLDPQARQSSNGEVGGWWTGLDSNQRTFARADLQSAAFNHSATCPDGGTGVPQSARQMAGLLRAVNAVRGGKNVRRVTRRDEWASIGRRAKRRALQKNKAPGLIFSGAGEGNRTLVVSLEGFCSTIELHPQLA